MSPRNRASAKAAGTAFESLITAHLREQLDDDRIERRAKHGRHDRGDIAGVRHMGGRIVIEAKDYGGRILPGPWLAEADVERRNDDAIAGIVVAKKRGTTNPSEQYVLMTVADLCALLTGERVAQ